MPSADISSNWGKPTLTMKQTYNVPISTTVDMCAERARGKLSHQNKKKRNDNYINKHCDHNFITPLADK